MGKYKYSFIIPAYTPKESDFRRCLDYIKNQTMKPFEVIVVDDASPSNVPQIAKEYGFKYLRHKINKHNGGARNTGIRESTGDYLIFCNSDDYFELDTIEQVDKVNNGEDLIIVGFSVFGAVTKKDRFVPNKENTPNISKLNWNGEAMHVVKRQYILDNNLFELENVPIADRDWTLRLEALKPTYTFVPNKALYNYQFGHEGAIMTDILNGKIVNNLTNPDYYKNKEDSNIDMLIYEHVISDMGGNVTSMLNFVKPMSEFYNITVIYKNISPNILKELRKYAVCTTYTYQHFDTDILVWNSSWGEYPNTISFKKAPTQILHADYEEVFKMCGFRYTIPNYPTNYVAVSNHVSKVFERMYGIKSKVIHNLLNPDIKVEKVLRLISCTRITKEKGLDNIVKFAQMLMKFNKKFIWLIFGNGNIPNELKMIPNIVFMGVSYDLTSYVADSDYLIHLSFSEGDPFCTKEALQVNVPCITTSYPATYEQIEDGVNGYILDFDLFKKGTDKDWEKTLDKIYNKIPKFQYENKNDEIIKQWLEVFGEPKGIKKDINNLERLYKVKAKVQFTDLKEDILRSPRAIYKESGDNTWIVNEERFNHLTSLDYIELVKRLWHG